VPHTVPKARTRIFSHRSRALGRLRLPQACHAPVQLNTTKRSEVSEPTCVILFWMWRLGGGSARYLIPPASYGNSFDRTLGSADGRTHDGFRAPLRLRGFVDPRAIEFKRALATPFSPSPDWITPV
jgi:hypothetical protein